MGAGFTEPGLPANAAVAIRKCMRSITSVSSCATPYRWQGATTGLPAKFPSTSSPVYCCHRICNHSTYVRGSRIDTTKEHLAGTSSNSQTFVTGLTYRTYSHSPSRRFYQDRAVSSRIQENRRLKSRQRFEEALEEYRAALETQDNSSPSDTRQQSQLRWAKRLKSLWEHRAITDRLQESESAYEVEEDQEHEEEEEEMVRGSRWFRPENRSLSSAASTLYDDHHPYPSSSTNIFARPAAGSVTSASSSVPERYESSSPVRETTTWTFAHQKLHFPTGKDWPPPLPGIPGEESPSKREGSEGSSVPTSTVPQPNETSSESITHPVSGIYPFPVMTCRPTIPPLPPHSPRDLAALALDVHHFSSRPSRRLVRKGSYKDPECPMSTAVRQQLAQAPGSDDTYHFIWYCGTDPSEWKTSGFRRKLTEAGPPIREMVGTSIESWLVERNSRLEYLGDAIAKEIASRIIYHTFPDLASRAISTASSHLTTNDTFEFLYEVSGLADLRLRLAEELLKAAVRKEKQTTEYKESRAVSDIEDGEILQVDSSHMEQIGRADRFEAYLAYIRIIHGAIAAEHWYSSLLRPWVDRIARDANFHNSRTCSSAALLRYKLEDQRLAKLAKEEMEERRQQELQRYRDSSWGRLAVAGRGMLSRLLGREERFRGVTRENQ